jgi:hypothetical protein
LESTESLCSNGFLAHAGSDGETEAMQNAARTRDGMTDAVTQIGHSRVRATFSRRSLATHVAANVNPHSTNRRIAMSTPTKLRLATALREAAVQAQPHNAAKYEAFAKRAETGEFDDYADTYTCPITQLYTELMAAGFNKFAARVANGEFDATKEESDAWAMSPAGQEVFKALPPAMRVAMFGEDPVIPDVKH